jgi:hypothetical protein
LKESALSHKGAFKVSAAEIAEAKDSIIHNEALGVEGEDLYETYSQGAYDLLFDTLSKSEKFGAETDVGKILQGREKLDAALEKGV